MAGDGAVLAAYWSNEHFLPPEWMKTSQLHFAKCGGNTIHILNRVLGAQRDADHALRQTRRQPDRLQHVRHLRVPRIARRPGGNGNPFQIKNMNEAFPRPARHQRRRRGTVSINTADQDITSQCPRVPPIRLIFPSSFNWLNIRSMER